MIAQENNLYPNNVPEKGGKQLSLKIRILNSNKIKIKQPLKKKPNDLTIIH
jgi:hypothetical protein